MMIKAKNGAIVNITSVVVQGNSGQSIYAATKSAITGFTNLLRLILHDLTSAVTVWPQASLRQK